MKQLLFLILGLVAVLAVPKVLVERKGLGQISENSRTTSFSFQLESLVKKGEYQVQIWSRGKGSQSTSGEIDLNGNTVGTWNSGNCGGVTHSSDANPTDLPVEANLKINVAVDKLVEGQNKISLRFAQGVGLMVYKVQLTLNSLEDQEGPADLKKIFSKSRLGFIGGNPRYVDVNFNLDDATGEFVLGFWGVGHGTRDSYGAITVNSKATGRWTPSVIRNFVPGSTPRDAPPPSLPATPVARFPIPANVLRSGANTIRLEYTGGGAGILAYQVAIYRKNPLPPKEELPANQGCFIRQSKCANFAQYQGKFRDPFTRPLTRGECFKRAQWFHKYCGNSEVIGTTAIWAPDSRTYTYQLFRPGDKVQMPVRHTIKSLCAKSTGSTTIYYGTICKTGNVRWEWSRTVDPAGPWQCTWKRTNTNNYNWLSTWFGDCDRTPSGVPQITSNKPSELEGLQRGWLAAGDKVSFTFTSTSPSFCSKSSGSSVRIYGRMCADGIHVEWQKMKTLDPRKGSVEDNCQWKRGTVSHHAVKAWFGTCETKPTDIKQISSTLAAELGSNLKRGWFQPGDEVYAEVKHHIPALCAGSAGSTTIYHGTICENGNVQWNSMTTNNPRAPYTSKQCTWSRAQTKNPKWLAQWLGSCNEPPTEVPPLTSSDPGEIGAKINKNTCLKNPCDKNAKCERVFPSSHQCVCNKGYRGDGSKCFEVNNCEKRPCHARATCTKTGPGKHTCKCQKGYKGDGVKKCDEIDACAKNPCDRNSKCKKTGPGAYTCICNKGFKKNGLVCEEIDVCRDKRPCDPNARCTKTGPGTFRCQCNKGFKGDGKTCAELNPCTGKNPCSPFATCKKTGPGSHICKCKTGYRGDGVICEEINACASSPCDSHGTCSKTGPGKYVCTCKPGYAKRRGVCEEVNNCLKKPCDKNAICRKTGPGTHSCVCKTGFKGSGTSCTPVNACLSNPCPKHSKCLRSGPGMYKCQCNKGFKKTGAICAEIDACKSSPCDVHAKCKKTGPGTFQCLCSEGYRMIGNRCEEIDMCAKNPCAPGANCLKTGPAKYKCVCREGYRGDGQTCEEIDKCKDKPFPCDKNAQCMKEAPGKFKCRCNKGWVGDGFKCEEKNACVPTNPCDKNAYCEKTGPGKYKCTCNQGFYKQGETCLEVDMCKKNPCDRNALCKKTGPGTFSCACNKGYEGSGVGQGSCNEINACTSSPCDPHATCSRSGPGQYLCTCQKGYKMAADGKTCAEIDVCKQVPFPCDQHASCTKTGPGGYLCQCKEGFAMNKKGACEEIDPCSSSPCERTAVCSSVRNKIKSADGEFRLQPVCTCLPGYAKDKLGKCVAVDPCASAPCDLHAICLKDITLPKSYKCLCKPGYALNSRTQQCEEIDACLSRPCGANSECLRTGPATHTCVCRAGYSMQDNECVETDACQSGPCGSHAVCQRTGPGTYACNCMPGFVMQGAACVPGAPAVATLTAAQAEAKKAADQLEAQKKKLEQEKLEEINAIRQKEELRRFGERLEAFLRQRRISREFKQDADIETLQSRIDELEKTAARLISQTQTQLDLSSKLLKQKQSENTVVEKREIIQHQREIDLLGLLKKKVDDLLTQARDEVKSVYAEQAKKKL